MSRICSHTSWNRMLRPAQPQLGPALPSIVGVASRVVGLQSRGLPVTPEGLGPRWLHDSLLSCFTGLQHLSRGLHCLLFISNRVRLFGLFVDVANRRMTHWPLSRSGVAPFLAFSSDARRGCGVDPISCLGDAARRAQES